MFGHEADGANGYGDVGYDSGEYVSRLLGLGFDVGRVRGRNVMMRCPFHAERRPSFGMNVYTGLFGCFSCGVRGNFDQFKSMLGLVESGEESLVGWDGRVDRFLSGNGFQWGGKKGKGKKRGREKARASGGQKGCAGKSATHGVSGGLLDDDGEGCEVVLGGGLELGKLCVGEDGEYDVRRDNVVRGLSFLDRGEEWVRYSPSFRYLLGRGVPECDMAFFMPAVSGIFPRRVVLPSIDLDGEVEYWQARDWCGKSGIKYVTPFGRRPEGLLMNLDRIRAFSDELIICEGPISAMVAGRHATCTYSQSFGEDQVYRIVEKGFDRVYVVYDGGESKALALMARLCSALVDHGVETWYCVLPEGKDPADMGREFFLQYLRTHAVCYTVIGVLASRLVRI